MLVEISLKVVYSNTCGKSYQIDGVRIPKKCIESIHFYSCDLPPHLKLVPSSYHHTLGRRKSLIPAGSVFFKNLFPPTAERAAENCYLLYQNSVR